MKKDLRTILLEKAREAAEMTLRMIDGADFWNLCELRSRFWMTMELLRDIGWKVEMLDGTCFDLFDIEKEVTEKFANAFRRLEKRD